MKSPEIISDDRRLATFLKGDVIYCALIKSVAKESATRTAGNQYPWRYEHLMNLMSLFSDRNLAQEGTAYLRDALMLHRAPDTINGNVVRQFKDTPCPMSYSALGVWWRVDFVKLVEVFAIKIMPGEFKK